MTRPQEILLLYLRYPAWALLAYGFSAGAPFKVILGVVPLYLRDLGYDLTTITVFSLLGLFFSLKFFWSPVLERPPLGARARSFGLRRATLLLLQLSLLALFVFLGGIDPENQWWVFVGCLVVIAFLAASQDIVIDALRIELMPIRYQGILSANYLVGYRAGLIVGGATPLYLADIHSSWAWSFVAVGAMFVPAILTTFVITEPQKNERPGGRPGRFYLLELFDTLWASLKELGARYPGCLLWIIALALLYRFCDVLLGVLAYTFYHDVGYSHTQIAHYSGVMGVIVTLIGGLIGGYCLLRYRWRRLMLAGLMLAALTNLAFVALAVHGQASQVFWLALTIVADNLAGGMATTVFIAWLSSLVNLNFTVIQYALLSSLSTLPGKLIGSGGGWFIDSLHSWLEDSGVGRGSWLHHAFAEDNLLMGSYAVFFLLSALVALPVWYVISRLPEHVVQPARADKP